MIPYNPKLIITILFLSIGLTTMAQKNDVAYAKASVTAPAGVAAEEVDLAVSHPDMIANFKKMFPSADNVSWSKLDNVFQVCFGMGAKKGRAVYSESGKMNYAICECPTAELPAGVTKSLSTHYPGYTVFNAREVMANGNTTWFIVLEDAKEFVSIKTADGQVEETSRIAKSHK